MKKKKIKKIKKMIEELTDKFEKELDVEVDVLNEKIKCIKETVNHIDERTMALDNVKVNNLVNHTKQLEDKIKILMDRASTNYNACSDTGITFENAYSIIKYMADRGATKDELDNIKNYFNKYIFRCRLFKITLEKEENNDD